MGLIKNWIYRLRGEVSTEVLVSRGLKVGRNFQRLNHVLIDDSHPWLIEIGDDVTFAPNVHVLAHDASTKQFTGYTRISPVKIGNRVFVGAGSIILPGVTVGDDVIIGAGSVVTSDIPSGSVAYGTPAVVKMSLEEFISKEKANIASSKVYGDDYVFDYITEEKKEEQKNDLKGKTGYIV